MTEQWLGTSISVFLVLTVCLIGGAAFMTGRALATTWRPVWQVFLYCLLLGGADRFLVFSLFQGRLLLFSGFVIDTAVITLVALAAYRATRARTMAAQYPWLYERTGLFTWRERLDRGASS